ncbi:MAG: hypothetical protein HY059_18565 [Proteobacteria bacterium]|nr:hypothetical protein [Pseudomonadota bacterium]
MNRSLAALLLLIPALPAAAQVWRTTDVPRVIGVPLEEPGLELIRAGGRSRRRRRPAPAPAPAPAAKPEPPKDYGRVAEEAVWKALVAKARRAPHRRTEIWVDDNAYDVNILQSDTPAEGQACKNGMPARNAFYLSTPRKPDTGEVRPIRISSVCLNFTGATDSFDLLADLDGKIISVEVFNTAGSFDSRLKTDPGTDAEKAALRAFLTNLLKLF